MASHLYHLQVIVAVCIFLKAAESLPRCEHDGFQCGNGGCSPDGCCGSPTNPSGVKDCCEDRYCNCNGDKTDCDCTASGGVLGHCDGSVIGQGMSSSDFAQLRTANSLASMYSEPKKFNQSQ